MEKTKLPLAYLERMRSLLGEEFPAFLAAYDQPRRNGLRVNTLKVSREEFEKISPFHLERIPWTSNGYYVDHREAPARHPYYRAGLYYLQEPSAMAPAQLLAPVPGERVLDLCAAPGGKATELGARLKGQGLLVANDLSASRAKALLRNIELAGIPNALLANTTADKLAERFPAFFDRVLVDAPCSGEGMFRKDEESASAWTEDKPLRCAAVQRDLVVRAADMLRPGGTMVYSTCTFAPEEDEWILAHLLRERPEMELLPITLTDGRESFSHAMALRELTEKGFGPDGFSGEDGAPEISGETKFGSGMMETGIPTEYAARIWPHRAGGEGHFLALIRKRGPEAGEDRYGAGSRGQNGRGEVIRGEDTRKKGRGRRGKARDRGGRAEDARIAEEQLKLVRAFTDAVFPACTAAASDERTPGPERLKLRSGQVFLNPEGLPDLRGISFLRCGLRLGEMKKDRFEPGQELAMAAVRGDAGAAAGGRGHILSFSADDPRIAAYLRGESIPAGGDAGADRSDGADPLNGWRLVCADGFPLGWGKQAAGMVKNKCPLSWRTSL